MNASPRLHKVAAVLLVVFLLTTVWAAYYLYSTTHASSPEGSTAVASYNEIGANSFAAAVLPSELYDNATEVYGGNVTLFTAITTWVNVSLVDIVTTNRTAAITLNESFAVNLSTSAWSKTLFTSTNATSGPATTATDLVTHYDVNVSAIVALANRIAEEVGYPSVDYTLSFVPVITGAVVAGGVREAVSATPFLDLNFSGALVHPNGLVFRHSGTLNVATPGAGPDRAGSMVATLALVASVGAFGGSTYVATRPSRPEELPPLADLLLPYEEAIAETGPLPAGAVVVPVAELADLVKVADTLGKPILRPSVGPSEPAEIVVLDGGIAYRYRHALPATGTPSTASRPPSSPAPSALPAAPAPLVMPPRPAASAPTAPSASAPPPLSSTPSAPSAPPAPPTSPRPSAPPPAASVVYVPLDTELEPVPRPPSTNSSLLGRLRAQTGRLREVPLDPWIRGVALDLAHRALVLLRTNDLGEAEKVIDGLERLITDGSRSSGVSRGNGR